MLDGGWRSDMSLEPPSVSDGTSLPGSDDMVAALIFLLLFATLVSARIQNRWVVLSLFVSCLVIISLLFWHHVTDSLNISL